MKRRTVYLGYIVCPKCKEPGSLYGIFRKTSFVTFVDFRVDHRKYNPLKFLRFRREGMSCREASRRNPRSTIKTCWLGKERVKV